MYIYICIIDVSKKCVFQLEMLGCCSMLPSPSTSRQVATGCNHRATRVPARCFKQRQRKGHPTVGSENRVIPYPSNSSFMPFQWGIMVICGDEPLVLYRYTVVYPSCRYFSGDNVGEWWFIDLEVPYFQTVFWMRPQSKEVHP
jgi:hypothetical protein